MGTEDLGNGRVRPVFLESVALTNEPNIKGARPIANRRPDGGAVLCPASTLRPRPSDRSEARLAVEHVKAQARQGHRQSRRP